MLVDDTGSTHSRIQRLHRQRFTFGQSNRQKETDYCDNFYNHLRPIEPSVENTGNIGLKHGINQFQDVAMHR